MEPIQIAPSERLEKAADVTWRRAGDALYLFAAERGRAYRLEGLQLADVGPEELRRVFGDSDMNVIRISNQI